MGLDNKTDWLTDRQSQCDFDLSLAQLWDGGQPAMAQVRKLKNLQLEAVTRKQLVESENTSLYALVICKVWR
jgi:hypothetical protein